MAVLTDESHLTEEKKEEFRKDGTKYYFKLAETPYETEATDAYQDMEYEAMKAVIENLPPEARQPGQGTDYFQPAVEYLENELMELGQELQFWRDRQSRGNPVLAKDADMMIRSLTREIEKNRTILSKLIYILPEDIRRNEFGAKYADLVCLRTLNLEQRKQVKAAVEDLRQIRLACYIKGDYGRSAAAADILDALERKLPWVAGVTGGANDFALGLPDYMVSREYDQQETDYDRFLTYMASADAVQAANPNAYAVGEAASKALSLVMAGAEIYKAGVRQFGDDAINMIGGKGQLQRTGEKTIKAFEEMLQDKLISNEMEYAADQQYGNAGRRG